MSKRIIRQVIDKLKNDEEVSRSDILKLLNYADEMANFKDSFDKWLAECPGNR